MNEVDFIRAIFERFQVLHDAIGFGLFVVKSSSSVRYGKAGKITHFLQLDNSKVLEVMRS